MLTGLFAVIALPVAIAIARGRPAANITALLAWSLGVPVIGWFVGMYLALDD